MTLLLPGVDPFPDEDEARAKAASAWFTPPWAADEAARMCRVSKAPPWRILEPSAGHGALIEALVRDGRHVDAFVDAVDLDDRSVEVLRLKLPALGVAARVMHDDYLTRAAPEAPYDLCLMNPPCEDGFDSRFVSKAMNESLRVVALVRLTLMESARSYDLIWSRVESCEWRLVEFRPFVARPAFLLGGADSDGGKTAFSLIKLSRVQSSIRRTSVSWVHARNVERTGVEDEQW